MKVRIGIDVGGTFTDAVAINNDTYELIGTVKVPTTHTAKEGVAAGIVEVLHKVMEENGIRPEDVTFIAHGTTQATNALLEGDVANVGIVTMGSGLQGAKSRSDTAMGSIELAAGKFLPSENVYVDTGAAQDVAAAVKSAGQELMGQGATSIVAAEAFSVDDPANENAAVHVCAELGVPGTATNDISKLYGLKIRTRTAVVNASIMPKMLEAATMTERSIQGAGIKSPLMVMRCDGGVMTVEEVRNRPILTILSGPAAGVAGVFSALAFQPSIWVSVTRRCVASAASCTSSVGWLQPSADHVFVPSPTLNFIGVVPSTNPTSPLSSTGFFSAHSAAVIILIFKRTFIVFVAIVEWI